MELFKSLEKRTKLFSDPFKHFEINQPLTQNAVKQKNLDVMLQKKTLINFQT